MPSRPPLEPGAAGKGVGCAATWNGIAATALGKASPFTGTAATPAAALAAPGVDFPGTKDPVVAILILSATAATATGVPSLKLCISASPRCALVANGSEVAIGFGAASVATGTAALTCACAPAARWLCFPEPTMALPAAVLVLCVSVSLR
jgi:hypothetical protein